MERNPNVEMNKLIKLLAKEDLPFEVYSFSCPYSPWNEDNQDFGIQIFAPNLSERKIDAVCHPESYGYKDGLIEIMSCKEPDVVGWLTAEEALSYFIKALKD
jgi:hypothetical protein